MTTWRSLSLEDSPRLSAFISACRRVDGDDPISDMSGDVASADTKNTVCAYSPEGDLIAAGWIKPLTKLRVAFGGKVRPDFRHRRHGNHLMAWAEIRSGELLQPGKSIQLVITNESLGDDAHRLYLRWGYEQVLAEEMRVYNLSRPFPSTKFPDGITRVNWSGETAGQFFQAYQDSFRDRPGFPNLSAQEWISSNLESGGFRPDLSVMAVFSNQPVGFITAEVFSGLGWISQVGVVPAWRGKGLARALVIEVLQGFRAESFNEVALHVNVNNPQAVHLYSQLGFVYRLTRARYIKEIKKVDDQNT